MNSYKPNGRLVTIVTAAWHPDGVRRAVKSVDDQTYGEWHHILVNDNNPTVREILPELCASDRRFWIDMGVRTHYFGALARNVGAMVAFSYVHANWRDPEDEWILFHDDDNYWSPNHIETLMETRDANPDAVLIASDAVWEGASGAWSDPRTCRLQHGRCDLGQFMYRADILRKYGYFYPHPRRKQKWDWEFISAIVRGEGEDRVAFTRKPTFIMNYRKQ